ncbi:hypothetical protein ACFW2D_40985 [Streptomyces sp. NPDC058914]|uniref:hypothetical protein n=1 Tax=Streptomyces TaxID=1883 RepID=UPI00369DF1CC
MDTVTVEASFALGYGQNEALAWSSSSLDDILMLLTQTASSHTDRAATLLLLLDAVLMNSHLWHQVIPVATLVADAASRARDPRSEGRARYILSGALTQVGRLSEAEDQVNRAVEASRDLEALVLGNGVQTRLRMEGMDEQTVSDSLRQEQLFRQLGDRQGEAFAHYRHGQVLARQGLPADAVSAYRQALDLLQEGEQDFVRAACLIRLSEAYAQLHRYQSARRSADEGLLLARAVRHEHLEAVALRARGDASFADGLAKEAAHHWHQALGILRHLGFESEAVSVEARIETGYPPA